MKEKWFDKAARIGARVFEVLHWAAALALLLMFAATFLDEAGIAAILEQGAAEYGGELSTYGFRVALTVNGGAGFDVSMAAFRVFLVTAAILIGLMAMVFRNVYQILRNSAGATPFTPDNIRLLREIGYFCIAQPVVGLITSPLLPLLTGPDAAQGSIDVEGFFIGVLALCLTRVFARGMALERDTEGLL